MKPLPILFYIPCFIDGLFSKIHAVILVQCPSTLDTAFSLALLQEEVGDSNRWKDFRHADSSSVSRWPIKGVPVRALPATTQGLSRRC